RSPRLSRPCEWATPKSGRPGRHKAGRPESSGRSVRGIWASEKGPKEHPFQYPLRIKEDIAFRLRHEPKQGKEPRLQPRRVLLGASRSPIRNAQSHRTYGIIKNTWCGRPIDQL